MSAREQAEEAQDEAAPRGGRLLALKLKRLIVLLAAPIALLRRLKRRKEASGEEPEESPPRREEAPRRRSVRITEEEEEVPAPTPSRWRRPLVYLAVLLVGAAAGAGSAYRGFSELVTRQSAEIRRQQAELAQRANSLAEARKKLDEQKAMRIEAENRLALILADSPSGAQRLAAAAAARSDAKGTTAQGGDCTLRRGSIGATLKDCIEAFNSRAQ